MGVFIIFAILLVTAILFTVFSLTATEEKAYTITQDNKYTRTYTVKSKFWLFWYNVQLCGIPCYISIGCIVVFSFVCIGLSIGAIYVNANQDVEYKKMQQQYVILTERLQKDNSEYHLFYEDITAYNNAVLEDRYWADNKWVNWYHNGKIQYLPLIGESEDNA